MRKISFIAIAALLFSNLFAQNITNYPYVEKGYKSDWGISTILGVIVNEENTIVILEDITSRYLYGGWISLSSKTTLSSKKSNLVLSIQEWGYYDEWNEEYQPLNFNERYSVESDRRYLFVMIFPSVPLGVENITIRENEKNEFVWEGIHINNNNPHRSDGTPSAFSSLYPGKNRESETFETTGSGTCFAISENGFIATACHVVVNASRIRVRGINGNFDKTYRVKVVASDKKNDVAILKIDDETFSGRIEGKIPYSFQNKLKEVGNDIIVLGYPLRAVMGDEIKLTNGLISSCTGFQGDVTTYQISATVQPGNSGGPLLDTEGNIIGVISSRLCIESAAYATKIPYLLTLISSLQEEIVLPQSSDLKERTRSEQIKAIKRFVYIIEVDN